MPAHIDGDHAIVVREMRCQVIKGMRDTRYAVQQDERRFGGASPFEVMYAQAVDRDIAVGGLSTHSGSYERCRQNQNLPNGFPARHRSLRMPALLFISRSILHLSVRMITKEICASAYTAGANSRHSPGRTSRCGSTIVKAAT